MRFRAWSIKLGILTGCLVLAAWTGPAFGEDGSVKGVERTSETETSALEAKQLSDAELDNITAGFNLIPPNVIHSNGIPGLGSQTADAALGANFGEGLLPAVQFQDGTLNVGLPAVQ